MIDIMTDGKTAMIEEFQCSGCVSGGDINCGVCKLESNNTGFYCSSHYSGTTLYPIGKIYLGLPKGFNRVGELSDKRKTHIRLSLDSSKISYDYLNVPVWAMEKDGYLFVRVYCPRINITYIDVIKGGILKDVCPKALNVADFIDDID
jgi:hypothetical protein